MSQNNTLTHGKLSNSTERQTDNSGIMQTYDLLKFAIARSNGSIFSLKHNTKCPSSTRVKQQKGRVTENKRQMYKCHEP